MVLDLSRKSPLEIIHARLAVLHGINKDIAGASSTQENSNWFYW